MPIGNPQRFPVEILVSADFIKTAGKFNFKKNFKLLLNDREIYTSILKRTQSLKGDDCNGQKEVYALHALQARITTKVQLVPMHVNFPICLNGLILWRYYEELAIYGM